MFLVFINFIFNLCVFALIYLIGYGLINLGYPHQISIWLFVGFGFLTEFIFVLISFSGFTYLIIQHLLGARYLTTREKHQLEPIIQDIIDLANNKISGFNLDCNDIKIMIHDKKVAFTQSIGNNTILVSDGFIKNHDEMEIKGAIANEIAHLFYKEGQIFLTVALSSLALMLINWIYWLYIKLWRLIKEHKNTNEFIKTIYYVMLLPLITFSPIIVINWLGLKLFDLSILYLKRKNEFRADEFVKQIGLADGLIRFLETQALITEFDNSIIGRLTSAHPAIMQRIDKLEQSPSK